MAAANRVIIAMLIVAAGAVAFWMLALGPKREEATELSKRVDSLEVSLAQAQSLADAAEEAKRGFSGDYRQLIVMGQAVPEGDETSSLLVELGKVADEAKVEFQTLTLTGGGESTEATTDTSSSAESSAAGSSEAVPASESVPPTEAAASLLPLGATIGTAGLGVMPYSLTFSGNFFQVADFIEGVDSLVETGDDAVSVEGRLLTIDGFALNADGERDFPHLTATFSVTTYVTPPEQGVTAGASPSSPAASSAESVPAEGGGAGSEESEAASETVSR